MRCYVAHRAPTLGGHSEGMGFNSRMPTRWREVVGAAWLCLRVEFRAVLRQSRWIDKGAMLLPALLAGAWHVRQIGPRGHLSPRVRTGLRSLRGRRFGNSRNCRTHLLTTSRTSWALRASVDAFVNLGHLIGVEHLERFSEAAKAVFGKAIEPPKADEVYRPAEQRGADTHSRWLRDGMMNTLLLWQFFMSKPVCSSGHHSSGLCQWHCSRPSRPSRDHRLLVSLQDQMALLAEAAPIPFLAGSPRASARGRLISANLRGAKGLIGSHAYYYGVLWGLEVVAWDPQLLLRASVCLAKLAKIDPSGTVSNRPINSLRAIFLSWASKTQTPTPRSQGCFGAS